MREQRKDIRLPPPDLGWDCLEFVDGLKAQIVGARIETADGIDWVKFRLKPFPDLIVRFGIPEEMFDQARCVVRKYPKHMIVTLNEDDPTRKLRFCLLNYDGKPTPATSWFQGLSQLKEIEKLRERMEQLRIENATLKEENLILKTNIPKYIKQNFSNVVGDLMPLFRTALTADESSATNKESR